MPLLPEPLHSTVRVIYDVHRRRQDAELTRPYLGASEIGQACERHLWLSFRWAVREEFDGRTLRLFDTGHREEAQLIEELRAAGMEVSDRDADGKQHGFVDGHFAGSIDGAVLGVPEAPKTWHLLECKTHSAKNFAKLEKDGVEVAFPRHYDQMQVYMGKLGFDRALYLAVCKDNDALLSERVAFNPARYAALRAKALRVGGAPSPAERLPPESFESTWCKHTNV